MRLENVSRQPIECRGISKSPGFPTKEPVQVMVITDTDKKNYIGCAFRDTEKNICTAEALKEKQMPCVQLIPVVDKDTPLLPKRQREVLTNIGKGLSAKETADELHLAPKTVKNYLATIRGGKFHTDKNTKAVLQGSRSGELPLDVIAEKLNFTRAENLYPSDMDLLTILSETGDSNQDLADKLKRSVKSIKNQLFRIFPKIDVENRTQAAVYYLIASESGLITHEK